MLNLCFTSLMYLLGWTPDEYVYKHLNVGLHANPFQVSLTKRSHLVTYARPMTLHGRPDGSSQDTEQPRIDMYIT